MKYFALLLIVLCTSCLGTKKISEKTSAKSTTETTAVKQDSVAKETVNKGIDDTATFKVAQSNTGDADFDARVNAAVANVLRSINFQKSSGDNSYQLMYNERLNQLEARMQVGETRNTALETHKDVSNEKASTEESTDTSKKVINQIRGWGWVVAFVFFFKNIMGVVGNIYPPARGIESIADLFNPPHKQTS